MITSASDYDKLCYIRKALKYISYREKKQRKETLCHDNSTKQLTFPVTNEKSRIPSDHQSAAWLYGPPLSTSGAAEQTEHADSTGWASTYTLM